MAEDVVRSRALRMRLDGLQSGVAQRHTRRRLAATRSALHAGRRRGSRRTSSSPRCSCIGAAPESRQNAFGAFQFIELISQLRPFSLDSRQALGNPLLFLPNLVQRCHMISPSSSPNSDPETLLDRYSALNGGLAHRKKAVGKKLLLFDGGTSGLATLRRSSRDESRRCLFTNNLSGKAVVEERPIGDGPAE